MARSPMLRPDTLMLAMALTVAVTLTAAADEYSERSYPIPGHGDLILQMPGSWRHHISQPPGDMAPTIELRPAQDDAFALLITPIGRGAWPGDEFGTPEMMRSFTEQSARVAPPQYRGEAIDVLPIGDGATGFYFSASDPSLHGKTPQPGVYGQFTHGQVLVGDLLCTFSMLSGNAESPEIELTLRMLRAAIHGPGG